MQIYESLLGVMSDIGAIGKNSKNSQQGWNFRGIDQVFNALQPALIKNGVIVVPEVLESTRTERVNTKGTNMFYTVERVKYTFYAKDGSSVSAIVDGEGMDTGDKSTSKALSIAFKYACFQVFCIPTEEMKQSDPDFESHEVAPASTPTLTTENAKDPVPVEVLKILKDRIGKDKGLTAYICDKYNVEILEKLKFGEAQVIINNFDKCRESFEKSKEVS